MRCKHSKNTLARRVAVRYIESVSSNTLARRKEENMTRYSERLQVAVVQLTMITGLVAIATMIHALATLN